MKIKITEAQYKRLKSNLKEDVNNSNDTTLELLNDLKNDFNEDLISVTRLLNTPKNEGDRYYQGAIDAIETAIKRINNRIDEFSGNDYYHDEIHGY